MVKIIPILIIGTLLVFLIPMTSAFKTFNFSNYTVEVSGNFFTPSNITSGSWIKGMFNWIVDAGSLSWLSFNGTTLIFNSSNINKDFYNKSEVDNNLSKYYLNSNPSAYWNDSSYNQTLINESINAYGIANNWNETANFTNVAFLNESADWGENNVSAQYFIGDGSQLTGIEQGELILYLLYKPSSDVSGNLTLSSMPNSTEVTLSKASLSDGSTLMGSWITDSGVPNINLLEGNLRVHVDGKKTGGTKAVQFYFKTYRTNASGYILEELSESEYTPALTSTRTSYGIWSIEDEKSFNTTDRIRIDGYAYVSGGGSAPSVEAYIQGDSRTRLALPVGAVSVEKFVPYTGAVNNVNLGNKNITASWINGIFNWIIGTESTRYLSFNGTTLNFNETTQNTTITQKTDALVSTYNSTWTSTYNSTYAGYADNVSINYTLQTYNAYDNRWSSTYNSTYNTYVIANMSNSTTWWSGISGFVSSFFFKNGDNLELNTTTLNITIDSRLRNMFDQSLNTTDSVTFSLVNATQTLIIGNASVVTIGDDIYVY